MKKKVLFLSVCSLLAGWTLNAQDINRMVLQANKIGAEIQPTMYGHFFEDINFGADGGLYAELVKNRSFDFPQQLMGWDVFGNVTVQDDGPFERNPHYVRLAYAGHDQKHTGIENEGFFGIGLKKDAQYRFTVWARGAGQSVRVELIDNASMEESQVLVSQDLKIDSPEWKQYEVLLTSPQTIAKAHLRIFLTSPGPVDLEHVSLFPVDTWKGHKNGLRKDLVQALADTKPGVFRFPGGCIVEGTDLATRYNWKNSVGPVENRPVNENRWHYTFPHRFFPDYFQSYGMGFFELFQLSEEIGAEPLPVLNCGLACQYQNDSEDAHVKVEDLGSYIQDALDLIEFANGGTDTKWGKLRAEMGHPESFDLKFIAIGNEQWGPEYPARLEPFVKAIRAAHPEIKIIGSSGPGSEGEAFDYLWPEMKRLKVDLVDEHFYRPEKWFLSQGNRYDNYDRKGPKVFAGEYACLPRLVARSCLYDQHRTQRRRGTHGDLRPPLGARRGLAVASRPDLVRQPPFRPLVQLLCAAIIRDEQGHKRRAAPDGRKTGQRTSGTERFVCQCRMGRADADLHREGHQHLRYGAARRHHLRGLEVVATPRCRTIHRLPFR